MSRSPAASSRLTHSLSLASRPFDGLVDLKDSLSMSEMWINGNSFPTGPISLPNSEFPIRDAHIDVYVIIDEVIQALKHMKLDPKNVNIACIGYGSVIASSSVIFDKTISEITSPARISLNDKNPLVFASSNGFDTHLFLYLAKKGSAPKGSLVPTIPGTWLAHAGFSVSPHVGMTRFAPTPMDSKIRKALGLPNDCLTYVSVSDDVIMHNSLEDTVMVYVDSDVLRLLQENPRDPLSSQIQLDLVVSTILSLLTKSAHIIATNGLWDSLDDPMHVNASITQLASQFIEGPYSTPEEILRLALEEPGILRALVESNFKLLKKTSAALREVQ